MKPIDVDSTNEQQLLDTVYNYKRLILPPSETYSSLVIPQAGKGQRKLYRRNAKFKVGDYVRLSKYRMQFEKGYTPNWTTEIFRVRKIQYSTDPITYLLNDYQDKEVEGSVYAEELQLVRHPNVYLIEKIIRKRDGKVFVKWLGFGSEHNSWIPETDVL